jgi:restriction endonuclease Mrr
MTKAETRKWQQRAKELIIGCLQQKGKATDRVLYAYVVDGANLTREEKLDLSTGGKRNTVRSLAGIALAALKKEGSVEELDGEYFLTKETPVILREDRCRREILHVLEKERMSKEELYRYLEEKLGTKYTQTLKDDLSLRSMTGVILKDLLSKGELTLIGGRYAKKAPVPVFEKGEAGENLKEVFLDALHDKGGPFFEQYFMALLENYYKLRGMTVKKCNVLGGSMDGGIDGHAETLDGLGFEEVVMVQTKCRKKAHVTEKEVREFYGAMCARGGTRGIFATTSTFHYGAIQFLSTVRNLVGVDGNKLFWMAKLCLYGIKRTKNGYTIDEKIFF